MNNEETKRKVWIVTDFAHCDSPGRESIVTAFDNEGAANAYFKYLHDRHGGKGVCKDHAPIFSKFLQT